MTDRGVSVRVPDERLDELAALAENATPGPWRSDIPRVLACDRRQTIVAEITGAPSNPETVADAEFIAAAGTDLAALVADLRAARADNQRLREALLLALNVLGDERLHPEAADTPLGVPGCLACDAIAAGEMALAEEPRA